MNRPWNIYFPTFNFKFDIARLTRSHIGNNLSATSAFKMS